MLMAVLSRSKVCHWPLLDRMTSETCGTGLFSWEKVTSPLCVSALEDVLCGEEKKSHGPGYPSSVKFFQRVSPPPSMSSGGGCNEPPSPRERLENPLYQKHRSAGKCTVIQCTFVRWHVCVPVGVCMHTCTDLHMCACLAVPGLKEKQNKTIP